MDIATELSRSRSALDEFMDTADGAAAHWTDPRAPGKWSPAQVAEHVATAFDQAGQMIRGESHAFPRIPFFLRPLARAMVLNRVVRSGKFPNSKTFKGFDPPAGPETPAAARERLLTAHQRYADACQAASDAGGSMFSTVFGTVPVTDYMRFVTHHTHHHRKQITAGS